MGGDGNDGSTKSGRLVTNDGHQRRNNQPHAGDKLWGFHKNSAYGFLNRITHSHGMFKFRHIQQSHKCVNIVGFTPKVQVIVIKHSISLITISCELLRTSKCNPSPVEYYKGLSDYY